LAEKSLGKQIFGSPQGRLDDIVKMDLREIGYEGGR
jgi:hypothetical protein